MQQYLKGTPPSGDLMVDDIIIHLHRELASLEQVLTEYKETIEALQAKVKVLEDAQNGS